MATACMETAGRFAPSTAPRTGLIVNPDSFRASRRGFAGAALDLARRSGVPYQVANDPAGFGNAVEAVLAESPQLLTILGGDGTIHAIVTHLIEKGWIEEAPPLLLLGGGRTNLTAVSVNTARQGLDLLQRVIDGNGGAMPVRSTATLAVRTEGMPVQYGFFLAGALIAQIVQDCHEWRSARRTAWRRSNTGTVWRLLSQGARSLIGRSPYRRPSMSIQADPLGTLEGPMRLLMLSTLENFGRHLDPFARHGAGDLRIMATRTDAQYFCRHALALARGRQPSYLGPEQGYLSGRMSACRLQGYSHYCIDGQAIQAEGGELTVETGPAVNLVYLPGN